MTKRILFLDDFRDPHDEEAKWLSLCPVEKPYDISWVKSYDEFVAWIHENGLPDHVCFDHDLADEHYNPAMYEAEGRIYDMLYAQFKEKTGLDCAKWLGEYCMDNKLPLPQWSVHSQNPVGRDNIHHTMKFYLKHTIT